jgi:hypothetical protein
MTNGASTDYLADIPQALTMMHGGLIQIAAGLSSSKLLKSLEAPFISTEQRLETIFVATLSRPPRDDEKKQLLAMIQQDLAEAAQREALADILWALLNSAEFLMNH